MPEPGIDPSTQLGAVEAAARSVGLECRPYRWATGTAVETARALLHLRRLETSFIATQAEKFRDWLRSELPQLPEGRGLAIVGYSAGGSILYRWLCSEASDDEMAHLAIAVAIAAPHTCPNPLFLETHPADPFPVREPPVPAGEIVRRLETFSVPLVVFLGGRDITVPARPPDYARFPSSPLVEEAILPRSTHLSICDDVADQVASRLIGR